MSEVIAFPERVDVVGTAISATSYAEVLDIIEGRPDDRATVIAVCNVHSVMTARRDPKLRDALANADVATPDGMPLVWAIRWLYGADQQRVYGPDLMEAALTDTARGLRHFLYGSTEETLNRLGERIPTFAPEAEIVGTISPPFRDPSPEELAEHAGRIRDSGANVVWVGLGMPKQELWMESVRPLLPGVALVGVGAAFDFLAGTVRQAPRWVQGAGLEWLFRLAKEPRRLWRRYLFNNPLFVVILCAQVVGKGKAKRLAGAAPCDRGSL